MPQKGLHHRTVTHAKGLEQPYLPSPLQDDDEQGTRHVDDGNEHHQPDDDLHIQVEHGKPAEHLGMLLVHTRCLPVVGDVLEQPLLERAHLGQRCCPNVVSICHLSVRAFGHLRMPAQLRIPNDGHRVGQCPLAHHPKGASVMRKVRQGQGFSPLT